MRGLWLVVFMALGAGTLTASAADGLVSALTPTAHGVYLLTFNVSGATQMPAGATINCKARVIPNLGSGANWNMQPMTTGTAMLAGSKAHCTLELPFPWTESSARSGALLSYDVEVFSAAGTRVRKVSEQGLGVAAPPAGITDQINVDVRF